MKEYLDLLREVVNEGEYGRNRTGIPTYSTFGKQIKIDLREGFPLLTTKKVHFKSIVYELLWFLSGSTNVKDLQKHGVTIWDEWATKETCARFGRKEGDLGPVYGHQWRRFGEDVDTYGIDQISELIKGIVKDPMSRRLIVTGWNPQEVNKVALPPCHTLFQFHISPKTHRLSCHLYQRSADIFLGVPFNIASYALLTHMVAHVTGRFVGYLTISYGNLHLYENHEKQAKTQLERTPLDPPELILDPKIKSIFDFKYEDITLKNYEHLPAISAKVAV